MKVDELMRREKDRDLSKSQAWYRVELEVRSLQVVKTVPTPDISFELELPQVSDAEEAVNFGVGIVAVAVLVAAVADAVVPGSFVAAGAVVVVVVHVLDRKNFGQ